jgi:DNA-binding response OmpR family regulator
MVDARVLIVSANSRGVARWRAALLRRHFAVTLATSCAAARLCIAERSPDVLVLDIASVTAEGLLLCRELRAQGIALSVLMLHAVGSAEDLVAGLEAGADAYLRGAFEPAELLGQVGALCRWRATCLQVGWVQQSS